MNNKILLPLGIGLGLLAVLWFVPSPGAGEEPAISSPSREPARETSAPPDTPAIGARTPERLQSRSGPAPAPSRQSPRRTSSVPDSDELDETPEQKIARLIEESSRSEDPRDRAFAVSELGLQELSPAVLKACLASLHDDDPRVREESALALEVLEAQAALPELERVAARDPNEKVRQAARDAAGALRKASNENPGNPLTDSL